MRRKHGAAAWRGDVDRRRGGTKEGKGRRMTLVGFT
jgi:hypothetical protein